MKCSIKYSLWLCLIVTIFVACSGNPPKEYRKTSDLKSIIGQRFILPQTPEWKIFDRDTVIHLSEGPRLVVFIKGSSCTPCSLKEFRHWKPVLSRLDSLKATGKDVNIIFIVNADGGDRNITRTLRELEFGYPILFDGENQFERYNLLPKNEMMNSFILNKNNTVKFIGNPLLGKNIRESFILAIQQTD